MPKSIPNLNSVCRCNKRFNEKTLHPLISVISLKDTLESPFQLDCYSIVLLKDGKKNISRGRKDCDFADWVLISRKPSQSLDIQEGIRTKEDGSLLLFHPDLLWGSPLSWSINDFSFLCYWFSEALHLSLKEKSILQKCFDNIAKELQWGVDEYSQTLICNHIELLLNYIQRFYTRQFITRKDAENNTIKELDKALNDYFLSGQTASHGLPSANDFELGASETYLNDLVKAQTGKSFQDYMKLKRYALAETALKETTKPPTQIAAELGFCSANCMASIFRQTTGLTLEEIRQNNQHNNQQSL